ncbi:MAG: DUF1580 domain-containing protein [Pirellulales bacterium]
MPLALSRVNRSAATLKTTAKDAIYSKSLPRFFFLAKSGVGSEKRGDRTGDNSMTLGKVFTVEQARDQFPLRPTASTIYRWIYTGIGGVRLHAIRCGGRRVISEESIQDFIDATTRLDPEPQQKNDANGKRTIPPERVTAIEAAEQMADALGL